MSLRTGNGDAQLHCSFCAKNQNDVGKLIAGPGVYICNECIDLCTEVVNDELPARSASAAPPIFRIPGAWESMTDEEILAHVPRVAAMSANADDSLNTWINRLRGRGVSWTEIAAALATVDDKGDYR